MSSIRGHALLPLFQALNHRGISGLHVTRESALDGLDPAARDCRINEAELRRLLHTAIRLSDDPAIALHAGFAAEPASLGALGHVLQNAATIGEACILLLHYWRLVHDEAVFQIEFRSDAAIFHIRRDEHADPEANRPVIEYLLAQLLHILATLGADANPVRLLRGIRFRHRRPEPQLLAQYQQRFGIQDFAFGSHENTLIFGPELLRQPVALADPALLDELRQQAEAELRAQAIEPELVSKLRALLRRRLLGVSPSIQVAAADCGMSRATLQRHLAAAGTSFSRELDRVRFELAAEMLERPEQRLADIAFTLGYCDSAAFHHAFCRWAGMTPGAYRASLG